MPLDQLDRSQMRSSQAYADHVAAWVATIEDELDAYRQEFGMEPPQGLKDQLSALKSDVRAEKALAARLSEQDAR